jgi:hypothetical protein
MIIYGAGLAGLLAANVLRSFSPEIREAKSELPNNHGALLRFRTDKVGTACAIPFKKVKVQKAIKYDGNIITTPNLFLSNLYSQKVTGEILSRSINNLEPTHRYIAPWHLIEMMAKNCTINYNCPLTSDEVNFGEENYNFDEPKISTIPMPMLMKIVGWKDIPDFPHQKIWTQKGRINKPNCDVYQTIYYPDPLVPYYRISLIGDVVISEYISEPDTAIGPHLMGVLMDDFGVQPESIIEMSQSQQTYGKIQPIDENLRKQFIFEMTTKNNIYSLGRFATWRQLLLDDVVEDCQHIERFINSSSGYSRLMHN